MTFHRFTSVNCMNQVLLGYQTIQKNPHYGITYWLKLISMEASELTKSCYNISLQMFDAGRINWVFFVKNMLYKYGFAFAFLNQGVGDKNNLSHCLNKD